MALAVDAGSGGLVFLPYLDGERTPNLPDATGLIVGLTHDTDPAGNVSDDSLPLTTVLPKYLPSACR